MRGRRSRRGEGGGEKREEDERRGRMSRRGEGGGVGEEREEERRGRRK